jgi:hypothetical protein
MNRTKISAAAVVVILILSFFLISKSARESELKIRKNLETELSVKSSEFAEEQAKVDALNNEKAALELAHTEKIASIEMTVNELQETSRLLTERVASLSKENEALVTGNQEKDIKIADLTRKIKNIEIVRLDLENQIKKLQDSALSLSIASDSRAGAGSFYRPTINSVGDTAAEFAEKPSIDPVKLGKIVVQKSSGYAVRVQHVNPNYGFIVINAGTLDGLKMGAVINIIRDKRLIGRAVIEKPRNKTSVAVIIPEWTAEKVEVGDFISKF